MYLDQRHLLPLFAGLAACASAPAPVPSLVENVPPSDLVLHDAVPRAKEEAPAQVRGPTLPAAWYQRRGQEIEAGLRRLQPVLQSCTAALEVQGELLVYFHVSSAGRVTLVRLEQNSLARGDGGFETCVKGALSRLHVTEDPGGEVVGVRKRYVFGGR